jgi:hypothetical protein
VTLLSEAATRLLIDLLDQPHPVLSGPALADFHKTSGIELIAMGLLVLDGHEAVDRTREHDDAPVALTASDDSPALGYFNPLSGWVATDPARLNRYRVNREAVARLLMRQDRRSNRIAWSFATDEVWDLGQLRVRGRNRRVPVILLRRVSDPTVWKRVRKWLIQNPSGGQRVLVSALPADRLPDDAPHGNVIMSLTDVIDRDGAFALDPQIIAARLDLTVGALQSSEPLVVLGDGREVRLYGAVFRFPKGDTQRRIICALYQHYLSGEHMVATAVIVSELGLPHGSRIRDYFKHCKPPALDRLLWVRDGLCGFCLKTWPSGAVLHALPRPRPLLRWPLRIAAPPIPFALDGAGP